MTVQSHRPTNDLAIVTASPAPEASVPTPTAPATPTPTATATSRPGGTALGLGIALLSALAFGTSGTFATMLMDTGWSAGAVVTVRIGGAALVLLVPTVIALRGRWSVLRRHAVTVLAYGLVAVAGCQLAYFSAVDRLSVGVALLLEYLAPVLIVGWAWLRHQRRPARLTLAGCAAALLGLALVLDVTSGARIDALGVVYGLLAALGLVAFFTLPAQDDSDLPPQVLAGGGLVVGALALAGAGAVGVLPMDAGTRDIAVAGASLPWWVAVVELVLVAAVLAYLTGVVAARMLGATVASFVGLSEVVLAVLVAWLLVGQSMAPVQLLGGLAILVGVICVRLGQQREAATAAIPGPDAAVGAAADATAEVAAGSAAPAGPEGLADLDRVD